MANAQRFDFTLGFRADTSQAQRDLNNLKNALNNLTETTPSGSQFEIFNSSIHGAIEKTAQLRLELEKATKANGSLDLGKLATEWKKSGTTLADYKRTLQSLGPAGQQAFNELVQSIRTAEAPVRELDGLIGKFTKGLLNTAMWTIQSNAIHGFQSALRGAFTYAQQLNKGLTDIAIVSDLSGEKLAQFAKDANKYAQQFSTTTNEYVKGALIYYQQGLSGEEVIEKTNTTVKMANTSGETAEQISSYMTAIWNNFDDGSKSVEYFADVISYLGAETAASNADIAEGMQAFAATANTVGLSYEYAASALTTLRHVTQQSASTIGNSLKTIFARLSSVSLGESLEDGVDLTKYTKALADVGVNVLDINGDLKAMDDILDSLAERWEDLTDAQKVAVAQTVGGVRQYNNLISLMDNYDYFQELVEGSTKSEGYLNKQAEIFEKSWQGALNHIRTALERLYNVLINDKAIIGLTNAFAKLLDVSGAFLENIGGLSTVIPLVFGFLSTVIGDKIAAGFTRAKESVTDFFNYSERYKNAETLWLENFQENMSLDNVGLTGHQQVVDLEEKYRKSVEKTLELAKKLTIEDRAQVTALAERNRQQVENLDNMALRVEAQQQTNQEAMDNYGLTVQWGNGRRQHTYGAAGQPDYDTRFNTLFKNYNAISMASNFLNNVHGDQVGADLKKFLFGSQDTEFADIHIPGLSELQMGQLSTGTGASVFHDFIEEVRNLPDQMGPEADRLERFRERFSRALERINNDIDELVENTESVYTEQINNQQAIVTNTQGNLNGLLQGAGIDNIQQLNSVADPEMRQRIQAAYEEAERAQAHLTELQQQHRDAVHQTVEGIRAAVTEEGNLEANTANTGIEILKKEEREKRVTQELQKQNASLMGNLNALISIGTSITVMTNTFERMTEAISSGEWGKFFSNFGTFSLQMARFVSSVQRIKPEFWTQGLGQFVVPLLNKVGISATGGKLAIEGLAASGASLGTKFLALIPVIGKIAAAIGIVVGAIQLLKITWENLSPSAKLKSLENATEDATKAAENANKEYDTLVTTLSGLKDKVKNIDDLDKGTQEWRNSVHELNKELQDLADKYGLTIGHGLKVENGHLALEDGYEEYIKQQETKNVNNANTIAADMAFGTAYQTFNNSSNSIGLAQFIQDFGLSALLGTDVGNAQVLQDFLNKQSQAHTVYNADSGLYEYDSQFHNRGYVFDAGTYGFDENAATELETLRTAIVARLLDEAANEGLNLSNEEVQEQATRLLGEIILNGLTDASTSDYVNEFGLTKTGLTGAKGYDFGDTHYDLSATRTAADTNATFAGVVESIQDERAGYGKLGAKAKTNDHDRSTEDFSKEDTEHMERYAEVVRTINDNWKKLNLTEQEQKKISEDLATDYIHFNQGLSDVIKNYKTYVTNLKEADESSMDFVNTIGELRNDLELMLDIDPSALSNDFFSENRLQIAKDLEEAAKGNWDALYDLQELAARNILPEKGLIATELQDEYATAIAGINNSEQWDKVRIGATFDEAGIGQEFADAMDELLRMGAITTDQLNNTFDAIGWEPIIDWVKLEGADRTNSSIKRYIKVGDEYQEVTGETTIDENTEVWVPRLNRQKTTFKGSPKARISQANKDAAKGNKSSGGSKNKSKEIDRYHEINSQIEQNAHLLDMVNTAEGRAYGPDKLHLMDEKIKLLERESELYKQLYDEAKAYYDADRARLANEFGAQFNEDGSITNYDKWFGAYIAKYNAGQMSDEQMQKLEDYIKKYEDSLKHLNDAEKKYQDDLNKIYDLKLEKIEYRLKTINKLIDQANDYLDHMIKQLDKSMYDTADVIALLGEKVGNVLQQAENERAAIGEIFANHGLSDEDIEAFISGQADIADILEKVGTLTEDEVSKLQEHQSALLKYSETLIEIREESYEKISESIDEFNEKIDRQIDIIKDLDGVMGHYKNIIDIVGKDVLGISDEMLKQMDQLAVTAAKSVVEISADQYNQGLAQLEAMRAREKELREQGLIEDADLMLKEIEAQEDRVMGFKEKFMGSWEDAENVIKTAFLNTIKLATDAFGEAMAGQAKTLDNLREYYDMQKTLQDRYLPTYQKIYELNKLTRDVNNAIDNTTNIAGKQRLLELQEDILKRQKEGVEVTEYEIGFLQRRLELEQARIAMEEAQNAKSMVRMTRDSEGNWSYTYTADSDKADAARQNYEDKLYELKKYNQESLQSFQEALMQATEDYKEKIADLNLTDEERAQKIKEFQEDWVAHNKDMFQMAIDDAHWIIGEYNGGLDDLIDKFDETILAHETGFTDLEEYMNTFTEASNTMINSVTGAYQQWQINNDLILEAAGTSVDDFKDKVLEDMKDIEESIVGDEEGNGGAVNAAKTLEEEMKSVFDNILKNLKNWFSGEGGYSSQIDSIAEKNKILYSSIQSLITQYNNLTKAATDYANAPQGNGPQGPGGTPGATNNGPDDKNGPGTGEDEPIDNGHWEWNDTKHWWVQQWSKSGTKHTKQAAHTFSHVPGAPSNIEKCTVCGYTHEKKNSGGGGSSGGGCFVAGTRITMANGSIQYIENIKIGDMVMAYNDETQEFEPREVTKSYIHHDTPAVINVYFEDGTVLGMTPGHPLLSTKGWKSRDIENSLYEHGTIATWLEINDEIINLYHQTVKVTAIIKQNIPQHYDTYNIEVETCHTFIADGMVVHNMKMFDSGGYTGSFGPEGRIAMLHEKELVLNRADTENLLTTISFVRDLTRMISLNAAEAGNGLGNLFSTGVGQGGGFLDQNVTIHAEFPNATNHSEIEEAFSNLIGLASQYAGRRK